MDIDERRAEARRAPYVLEERRRTEPHRDRIRLAVLAELGLVFAGGGDPVEVLQRAAAATVPALGDWCAVDLRGDDGVLRRVAVCELEGSADVERSRISVPLTVRGRVLGALGLARAATPGYDRDDLAFVEELSRRIALFVDHALLLRDQQRLIEELANMNAELDRFAYLASHDLKAPLRGIGNLAAMLEEDLGPRLCATERTYFGLLRGRAKRLEVMIDGVLAYCRAGRTGETAVEVDVGALVRELVELSAPPPDVTFEIEALPTLRTPRVPLEQVLLNLIGNAIKHARRPGAVTHVRIGGSPSDDGWELFVRDDGPGIAPEHHESIWGLFRTLASRDVVDTTGIGLALVRRIVESTGGRAWVESTLGEGATFRFTWPSSDGGRRVPWVAR